MTQVKSKERVTDHGEVFTAPREVNAMWDLVKDEVERLESRILEPSCGNGNFLTEGLRRKLQICTERFIEISDWEKWSLLVISTLYGVDIMHDNVLECRQRLFDIWEDEYRKLFADDCKPQMRRSVAFILALNIIHGNTLTHKHCNANNEELEGIPIIFSKWMFGGNCILRYDTPFASMLNHEAERSVGKGGKKSKSQKIEPIDDRLFIMSSKGKDDGLRLWEFWYLDFYEASVKWRKDYPFMDLHWLEVEQ